MKTAKYRPQNNWRWIAKAGLAVALLALIMWHMLPAIGRNLAYIQVANILTFDVSVGQAKLPRLLNELAKNVTLRDLGTLAYHFGSFSQAAAYYRDELLATNDPIARFMLGKVLLETGQRDEALSTWRPLGQPALEDLGWEYSQVAEQAVNRSEWQTAADWAEYALQLDPDIARAYYVLGIAQAGQNHGVEAVAAFRKALDLATDTNTRIATLVALGDALRQIGDVKGAIDLLYSVVTESPTNVRAHLYLARAYAADRRVIDAADEYQAVIALDGQAVDVYLELGDLFKREGDLIQAQKWYDQARQVRP
jgi:superkiller protein 3